MLCYDTGGCNYLSYFYPDGYPLREVDLRIIDHLDFNSFPFYFRPVFSTSHARSQFHVSTVPKNLVGPDEGPIRVLFEIYKLHKIELDQY